MIGKALVAISQSVIPHHIIQSFRKTGLYPVSFDTFVGSNPTLRDTPEEVLERVATAAQNRASELKSKALNSTRTNIQSGVFVVTR
jgi:hypothetical protein